MKAQKMYQRIKKNGTVKLIRSLESIKKICDELESKGVKIYVTKVGRECEKRYGSPKLQSIRNNKRLIAYIRSREQEQNIVPTEELVFNPDSNLIDLLNEYKRENIILRGLIKKMKII